MNKQYLIKLDLKQLGIEHDIFFSETELIKNKLVEKAVNMALESKRTGDIMSPGCEQTGTEGMTKAVLDAMDRLGR